MMSMDDREGARREGVEPFEAEDTQPRATASPSEPPRSEERHKSKSDRPPKSGTEHRGFAAMDESKQRPPERARTPAQHEARPNPRRPRTAEELEKIGRELYDKLSRIKLERRKPGDPPPAEPV